MQTLRLLVFPFLASSLVITGCGGPAPARAPTSSGGTTADASTGPAQRFPAPSLAPDEIRRVVGASAPALRLCYDEARVPHPALRGSAIVSWHIAADGHVSRAMIEKSTLALPGLEECLLGVFRAMVFTNGDGMEAEASWSFQFAPP